MTTLVRWLSRVTLGVASFVFLLIASKYVLDPVSAASASGLSVPTLLGQTNMRAGVGGFALGSAIIALVCLASPVRLRIGLWFVVGILGPVLLVRLYGVVSDGTLEASVRILVPETVLLLLASTSLALSRQRDRTATMAGIPDRVRAA